jgi:hypothetical protein
VNTARCRGTMFRRIVERRANRSPQCEGEGVS